MKIAPIKFLNIQIIDQIIKIIKIVSAILSQDAKRSVILYWQTLIVFNDIEGRLNIEH